MIRHIALLALITSHVGPVLAESHEANAPLRVLMTVGGVGYNTWIVRTLESNQKLDVVTRDIDDDAIVFNPAVLAEVDAVLMYHRDDVAEPEERAALSEYLKNGGGVVVLHHAIANYRDWEAWWRDHVGGLYVLAGHDGLPPSQYFHDFSGVVRPTSDHPITRRLGAFWRYEDESYDRLWVSNDVTVLLSTTAFGSDSRLSWIGPSKSDRVVYIQPGHGDRVLTDPKYLMLIEDALRWVARDRT